MEARPTDVARCCFAAEVLPHWNCMVFRLHWNLFTKSAEAQAQVCIGSAHVALASIASNSFPLVAFIAR